MKIRDLDLYITHLCKILPPEDKEDMKTVNKLKLFIEKYIEIDKNNSILNIEEEVSNKTIELAYHRSEMCKEVQIVYKNWTEKVNKLLDILYHEPKTKNEEFIVDTTILEDFKILNKEFEDMLNRLSQISIAKKDKINSHKCIIKYFKAL